MNFRLRPLSYLVAAALLTLIGGPALAVTVEQALKLAPSQKDVDYDKPPQADVAKCTIAAEKIGGQTAWVVRGPSGELLRQFVDTNNDNVVDRWSYFKDGVEVYRDIDENFNGRPDQHRWMNLAGSRWGIDKNEDGKIDSWKAISAEEVTSELVMALRDRDEARYARLLITPNELNNLGLGKDKLRDLTAKLTAASGKFKALAAAQKMITAKTTWQYFAASRPAMIPAGTEESTADILVYENVIAMVETGAEHGQLHVGAMVKVGDVWRLVELPKLPNADGKLSDLAFTFVPGPAAPSNVRSGAETAAPGNDELQTLLSKLEQLDKTANSTTGDALNKANDDRCDVLLQLAATDTAHRAEWMRQLSDVISAAVQGGGYPGGVEKLRLLSEKLEKNGEDAELAGHTRFCYLAADYNQSLQDKKGSDSFPETQKVWVANLEQFVKDFPKTSDTSEALLQLGIAEEFGGQEDLAKKWYGQLVDNFKQAPAFRKAAGSLRRLDAVGKPLGIVGRGLRNEAVDTSKLTGKVVLIQYWATWCQPCITDMAQIKQLKAKYGKSFEVVGINLDSEKQTAIDLLKSNPAPWPTLWEKGGLESPYANDMGILTLPTMVLIDGRGNVVNRGLHITDLDNELKNLIK